MRIFWIITYFEYVLYSFFPRRSAVTNVKTMYPKTNKLSPKSAKKKKIVIADINPITDHKRNNVDSI